MSLRGVKKALYRSPHQLLGGRSRDDPQIKAWEHDIDTAMAGLDYLQKEAKRWRECWESLAGSLVHVVGVFNDIHSVLGKKAHGVRHADPDSANSAEEQFSYITHHELGEAYKLVEMLSQELSDTAKVQYKSVSVRCKEMRDYLKAVQKLLTKRNHKKIDYDMTFNTLEKMVQRTRLPTGAGLTTPSSPTESRELTKIDQSQNKLEQAKQILDDFDAKVRTVLPPVLETLSEFLNKLSMKIYFWNLEALHQLRSNLGHFAESQGLLGVRDVALTYESIMADYGTAVAPAQSSLESLHMLQEYQVLERRIKERENNFKLKPFEVETHVKTFNSKEGMFRTATDPLRYILQNRQNIQKRSYAEESQQVRSPPPPLPARDYAQTHTPVMSSFDESDDWMKPLSLKRNARHLSMDISSSSSNPSPPSPSKGDFSGSTENTSPSITPPVQQSYRFANPFYLVENSETARYASVSLDKITLRIQDTLTTPAIESAPVTLDPDAYRYALNRFQEEALARSSVSALLLRSAK